MDRIFDSYLERGIRPCVQIGGQPKDVGGRVRMGISSQLRNIDNAFAVIARYPEFANTPIVIDESDPEGCAACQGPDLAYRRILSSEESWRMDWPSSTASKLELLPAERQLIRNMAGHIVAGVASDEETRAFRDFCASLA